MFQSVAMNARGGMDDDWRVATGVGYDEVGMHGVVANPRSGCVRVQDIRADSRSANV